MVDEDYYVYVKRSKNKFMILLLYVDNILLASNNKEYVQIIKEWLSVNFDMKDMGEATYIPGVKIERDHSKKMLTLSQEHYIGKILKKFRMQDSKSIDTLIAKDEGLSLRICPKTPDEKAQMEKVSYSSAVGSLIYDMMCTRPDISFVVAMVSRYQTNPKQSHWTAVKIILRYLKCTIDYSLCFQGENIQLMSYADADWGEDLDEIKSTSDYVFLLNNGVISWSSKK
jgi:Reverse transcriptase (RNA-dependent DNA polymerase)